MLLPPLSIFARADTDDADDDDDDDRRFRLRDLVIIKRMVLYYKNIIIISVMENPFPSQRKWFITFGGPTNEYHNAVARVCREANEIGAFDHIIGYT